MEEVMHVKKHPYRNLAFDLFQMNYQLWSYMTEENPTPSESAKKFMKAWWEKPTQFIK